jgi:hypothetical protein
LIVTIHQPEHLPWLGFFHKMTSADLFVCLDTVQYRKNYFQNRNRVLTANGPAWVTVPVLTRGHTDSSIGEMRISPDDRWPKKYWATLQQAYGKHPFFPAHAAMFREVIEQPWEKLVDLNLALIKAFLEVFGLSVPIRMASELDCQGSASQLLADICRRLKASVYLSGPSGRDYLDESFFVKAGIAVRYHDFSHPAYPQKGADDFVSNLSAFDLLMNVGPEGRRYILPQAHTA